MLLAFLCTVGSFLIVRVGEGPTYNIYNTLFNSLHHTEPFFFNNHTLSVMTLLPNFYLLSLCPLNSHKCPSLYTTFLLTAQTSNCTSTHSIVPYTTGKSHFAPDFGILSSSYSRSSPVTLITTLTLH